MALDSNMHFVRVVTIFLCCTAPGAALAWGSAGHRMISVVALQNLPDELPSFLRSAEAVDQISELSREPDRSRGAGTPHDDDLNPGHYVNIDDNQTVFGVRISPLPANREEYDSLLRANGSDEYRAGYLPYAIVDGWQQLQKDFAYWRVDVVGERSAPETEREWFAKDRRLNEALIIQDLGYWSHFVEDASQPLHVSVHYDGWGNYPNPNGYTNQRGFHAFFDGAFVRAYMTESEAGADVEPYQDCRCSIQDRTVSYLLKTQSQVTSLYELQKRGALNGMNEEGNRFTAQRLAAGASELRNMIVDAWRSSINATVGYPPSSVRDIESGAALPIQEVKGTD
jgi:hypothetical protein